MKRLRSLGIGISTKQAEPITDAEEERLWMQGKLGPDTPHSLLDTMVYMCCLYFALRSGQEHRNLSVDQLKLVEPADSVPHLVYTENVSKNNPGGLHNRKLKPKTVIHHANLECPSRCSTKRTWLTTLQISSTMPSIWLQFAIQKRQSGIHLYLLNIARWWPLWIEFVRVHRSMATRRITRSELPLQLDFFNKVLTSSW